MTTTETKTEKTGNKRKWEIIARDLRTLEKITTTFTGTFEQLRNHLAKQEPRDINEFVIVCDHLTHKAYPVYKEEDVIII